MLQNYDIDITEFVKITNAGVKIADFSQVRAAIIRRYQNTYGSDIDLSTGSADGIFVYDMSLLINNVLQGMKTLYANLDVNTASGVYLDALCALSNVVRKDATYSTASILVENTNSSSITYPTGLSFVDQSGLEWLYEDSITFLPGETQNITVRCSKAGKISAPANWITQTIDISYLSISQTDAAIVGSDIETDSALRNRRSQSTGAQGTTVLESLVGALLKVNSVEDVKIYNNNSSTTLSTEDGTDVEAHSVYVIIRKADGVEIADSVIGSLIFEKLTPGIHTTKTAASISKSYSYQQEIYGESISLGTQIVYWKEAVPIGPSVNVTITPYSFFATTEIDSIASALFSYLNGLTLSAAIDKNQLLIETIYADPQYKGAATYAVNSVDVSNVENLDTYYKYDTTSYVVNLDDSITITLSMGE